MKFPTPKNSPKLIPQHKRVAMGQKVAVGSSVPKTPKL